MTLLRYIPQYRALCEEVERLTQQNAVLECRVDAAESERARVWAELQKALDGERKAYQMVVNEHWQTRYGVTPHPDAPSIPINRPVDEGGPVRAGHNYGGAVVATAHERFKQQYMDRINKSRETQPAA